jgi:dimethylaniline monooxygenase (N-oxide forming)
MKVGIIGAGPAGLCAIKHSVAFNCDVVAFEQTESIGGTWNFTNETGRDKYGIDVHSSMYQGLFTNIPKEIMSYPDFPYQTHEKSFVSSGEVLKYFHLYAETFDLFKHIRFQHHVLRVCPRFDDKWEFTVRNLRADKLETYVFDAVLVCNGFSAPFMPKIPGQEVFVGKQMHSHLYRSSDNYQNERVLVIGGGERGLRDYRNPIYSFDDFQARAELTYSRTFQR